MNVTDYVAQQTVRMAESLCHFISTTPEDRQVWRPTLEGAAPTRSILEQVGECVAVNHAIAGLIRGEQTTPPTMPTMEVAFADATDAQEKLRASAQDLASAIRGMAEEDLARTYQHPRGLILGQNLILMCLRNMAYHAGQANLIQMLYGDAEFHVPPNWR